MGAPRMTDREGTKIRFETALECRHLEIRLFWQRALFFWGFVGVAFVGVATSYVEFPFLALVLSSFGLICSLCWALANRGSKYW